MIDFTRFRKVLTFFAHPDDETLAAGATISKLTRMSMEVHAAIPATGVHSRRNMQDQASLDTDMAQIREDCRQALGILGVPADHIAFGEFPDNEMDQHSLLEVIHWLEEVIRKVQPDLILSHHRYCTNVDHRICHEAAVVATRPGTDCHITVLCGEVPSSTGYLRPAQWEPNLYVEASEEDIIRKVQAMEAYSGEIRQDSHPRSPEVIRALAKVRGSESGYSFAEAFMIQKMFG